MEIGFNHLHSLLRWILLILLLLSVSKVMLGSGKRFFDKDRKMALLIMILAHVQFLLGLSLYFMRGFQNQLGDMGDSLARFRALEHPLGMIIAIVLITIGYGKIKRAETDAAKFRAVKIFFGMALLLILISIPWPFREGMAGYGWF
jgi:hypothetical protein